MWNESGKLLDNLSFCWSRGTHKKIYTIRITKKIILFWPDDTGRNTKQNFSLTNSTFIYHCSSSYFRVFPFSLFFYNLSTPSVYIYNVSFMNRVKNQMNKLKLYWNKFINMLLKLLWKMIIINCKFHQNENIIFLH